MYFFVIQILIFKYLFIFLKVYLINESEKFITFKNLINRITDPDILVPHIGFNKKSINF